MPEIRSVRVTDFSDVKAPPVSDVSKAPKVALPVSLESGAASARFKVSPSLPSPV
jgi:hypothetical protein